MVLFDVEWVVFVFIDVDRLFFEVSGYHCVSCGFFYCIWLLWEYIRIESQSNNVLALPPTSQIRQMILLYPGMHYVSKDQSPIILCINVSLLTAWLVPYYCSHQFSYLSTVCSCKIWKTRFILNYVAIVVFCRQRILALYIQL